MRGFKHSIRLLIFIVLSSCSSETEKIGFLIPNSVDERMQKDQTFFVEKIKGLGGEVLISDAQFDDQRQIEQAKELISQGVKVLVVMAVNKNTAAAIVRYAHDKNIKVIAYERIIANCDLDYYLSFDNVKVGELMATYAIKAKPAGNFAIFSGDKGDQNAVWVKEGQMKILQQSINSGKIKIVYDSYIEDWSGENAHYEMSALLNLSMQVPDAILSAYDGMSRGIIQALDENSIRPYPIITGQNAELQSCRDIVNGKQSMTIYKSIKTEAYQAAELAMKCAKNEEIETTKTVFNGKKDIPSILIEPISVDIDNIKNTVIRDGFLKMEDVYTN